MGYAFRQYGRSLSKTFRTDIEGRLAAFSFREASSCEARARKEGLPTGECGTHIEGNGRACVCVSVRGARQGKRHVFALRHWSLEAPQCQYEQLPGGLCVFRQHTVEGAEAGPVRNLKERWGVGTEGKG